MEALNSLPEIPLDDKLVERLKRSASRIELRLGRMMSVDPRHYIAQGDPNDPTQMGRRVRAMKIHRNYPELDRMIIKRVHFDKRQEDPLSAQEELDRIREMVEEDKKYPSGYYTLQMPYAYAINPRLIAMAETDAPTISQLLEHRPHTLRADELLMHVTINPRPLQRAAEQIHRRLKIGRNNIFCLGRKKGKWMLMPVPDLI